MTLDLLEFLTAFPPDTDHHLVRWDADQDHVRCELQTSPWWVGRQERQADNGRILIECSEILTTAITLGWRAAEVEDLGVSFDDPLLWRWGQQATIYGNSPLPDPDRFFLAFLDLMLELGQAQDFTAFTGGVSYDMWRQRVTSSSSFHLLEGPCSAMEACRSLLEAQGANYVLLKGPLRGENLILVTVGESWIACRRAQVSISPAPRAAELIAAGDVRPGIASE